MMDAIIAIVAVMAVLSEIGRSAEVAEVSFFYPFSQHFVVLIALQQRACYYLSCFVV